ncbi:hypothetical protein GWI33_006555 [Rhynchophorus ferrugineus]|uniref:Uncharacterized protein n=1 Tax=Rhynchophorus ferrugineus TaxID=354439 RepID=A0A834MKX7_RHYFE|nr:hypothetical protein GWI33_006555 [Rhynchophorus ferrugineus]
MQIGGFGSGLEENDRHGPFSTGGRGGQGGRTTSARGRGGGRRGEFLDSHLSRPVPLAGNYAKVESEPTCREFNVRMLVNTFRLSN